ncbi:hypothetical protein ACFONC_11795 [Luteimonas soli]|uniref:Uncharacterized protein n=1 Tax=Luteimonas soli TaxID=1648966 RepID=A0ABV7XPQ5_9GAMM
MADQYVVLPLHAVRDAKRHDDPYMAADEAARLVEKDRAPRVVLRVMSEISVAPEPKLAVVQIAEVPGNG